MIINRSKVFLQVLSVAWLSVLISFDVAGVFAANKTELFCDNCIMKVNFYTLDSQTAKKGWYLGFAELRDDGLFVEVSDSGLQKLLNQPYAAMDGKVDQRRGVAEDWVVSYEPGTREHLEVFAHESWRFGYISEILKD